MQRRTGVMVSRKISLRAETAGAIDDILFNESTDRRHYGALSRLVEKLLKEWLAQQAVRAPAAPAAQQSENHDQAQ